MSKYFNYFNQVFYDISGDNKTYDTITNLTTKFSFSSAIKDNSVLFYKYSVIDGETPEVLAHKLYGSSEKHWILLSVNNITDPRLEWPIEQRSLIDLIEKNYVQYAANGQSGLQWAQSNIHSRYIVEKQLNPITSDITSRTYTVDSNTYNTTEISTTNINLPGSGFVTNSTEKFTQTFYEYEVEKNDDKRIIKILKPEYAPALEQEFRNIFK